MSLSGLDAAAVEDAYQAVLEKEGWFLLRYTARNAVGICAQGDGGVAEMRDASAEYYKDESNHPPTPLFGMIHFRRRKVLIKLINSDASRLAQARAQVQWISVASRFTDHDSVCELSATQALTESAITALTDAHSTHSSPHPELANQATLNGIEDSLEENTTSTSASSFRHELSANGPDLVLSSKDSSSSSYQQVAHDNPALTQSPMSDVKASLELSPSQCHDMTVLDSINRRSSQLERPTTTNMFGAPLDLSFLDKPKIKLGPRPSAENKSLSARDRKDIRPTVALPAGLCISRSGSQSRPQSRESLRTTAGAMRALPVHIPKPNMFLRSVHHQQTKSSCASVRSLPATLPATLPRNSSTRTEKERLLRFRQIYQQKSTQQVNSLTDSIPSRPSQHVAHQAQTRLSLAQESGDNNSDSKITEGEVDRQVDIKTTPPDMVTPRKDHFIDRLESYQPDIELISSGQSDKGEQRAYEHEPEEASLAKLGLHAVQTEYNHSPANGSVVQLESETMEDQIEENTQSSHTSTTYEISFLPPISPLSPWSGYYSTVWAGTRPTSISCSSGPTSPGNTRKHLYKTSDDYSQIETAFPSFLGKVSEQSWQVCPSSSVNDTEKTVGTAETVEISEDTKTGRTAKNTETADNAEPGGQSTALSYSCQDLDDYMRSDQNLAGATRPLISEALLKEDTAQVPVDLKASEPTDSLEKPSVLSVSVQDQKHHATSDHKSTDETTPAVFRPLSLGTLWNHSTSIPLEWEALAKTDVTTASTAVSLCSAEHDDDLVRELQDAIVQEAKPMAVSKSPVCHISPKKDGLSSVRVFSSPPKNSSSFNRTQDTSQVTTPFGIKLRSASAQSFSIISVKQLEQTDQAKQAESVEQVGKRASVYIPKRVGGGIAAKIADLQRSLSRNAPQASMSVNKELATSKRIASGERANPPKTSTSSPLNRLSNSAHRQSSIMPCESLESSQSLPPTQSITNTSTLSYQTPILSSSPVSNHANNPGTEVAPPRITLVSPKPSRLAGFLDSLSPSTEVRTTSSAHERAELTCPSHTPAEPRATWTSISLLPSQPALGSPRAFESRQSVDGTQQPPSNHIRRISMIEFGSKFKSTSRSPPPLHRTMSQSSLDTVGPAEKLTLNIKSSRASRVLKRMSINLSGLAAGSKAHVDISPQKSSADAREEAVIRPSGQAVGDLNVQFPDTLVGH